MENGNRETSVQEFQLLAKLFSMTTDQILNFEGQIPQEVSIEDKKDFEKINLIYQLDEENKQTVIQLIVQNFVASPVIPLFLMHS